MSIRNHVNLEISLLNETRNEIDVHYGRNKDCLQNGKFYSRIYKCISAKIAGKIGLSVHESETSFNPE